MTSQDVRTAPSDAELNAMAREDLVELFLTLRSVELSDLVGLFEGDTPDYLRERFAATANDDGCAETFLLRGPIGPAVSPDDPGSELVDAPD